MFSSVCFYFLTIDKTTFECAIMNAINRFSKNVTIELHCFLFYIVESAFTAYVYGARNLSKIFASQD